MSTPPSQRSQNATTVGTVSDLAQAFIEVVPTTMGAGYAAGGAPPLSTCGVTVQPEPKEMNRPGQPSASRKSDKKKFDYCLEELYGGGLRDFVQELWN